MLHFLIPEQISAILEGNFIIIFCNLWCPLSLRKDHDLLLTQALSLLYSSFSLNFWDKKRKEKKALSDIERDYGTFLSFQSRCENASIYCYPNHYSLLIFGIQTFAFASYFIFMYISVDNVEQSIIRSVSSYSFTDYLFCTHISNKNLEEMKANELSILWVRI